MKRFVINFILNAFKIILLFYPLIILSQEVKHFIRSPRALLMGDAFTAIADDEYTLFYNPAALGRHSGLSLNVIDPQFAATNALEEKDRFEDFPKNDPSLIADRILGLPLYINMAGSPGLKMEHFGLSLLARVNTDIVLRNAIHPSLDMYYSMDRGFILGQALVFGNTARGKSATSGSRTSLGFSLKHINRQGLYQNFDLFGADLLTRIAENGRDIDSLKSSLGFSYGKGWGGDVGIEHTYFFARSQLNFALSVLDVGDTRFPRSKGTGDIPSQKMTVNAGTAWSQDFFIFDYKLAFDYHPINSTLPIPSNLHFGLDIGLPLVRILCGFNGGYISYGAAVVFWPIKIYAGFYGVETGVDYKHFAGKRAIFYLSLMDFTFDV